MHVRTRFLTAAALALAMAGCRSSETRPALVPPAPAPPVPAVVSAAETDWHTFVDTFIEETLTARPGFAVKLGRHEFDGRVADLSAEGLAAEVARLQQALEKARAFDDGALNAAQRFERSYLVAHLEGALFWLVDAAWPARNPLFYVAQIDPEVYLTREYAPLADRLRAYTALARNVPLVVEQTRAGLRTPMPRTHAALGREVVGNLAGFMRKDVPAMFASVEDATLQAEMAEANGAAVTALDELARWFKAEEARGTNDFALGPDLFARMLARTEGVTTPLDELERLGRADLERNRAALVQACAKIAPRKSLAACVNMVNAEKPREGPVLRARAQLVELEHFLQTSDLVTIPGKERATVEEAPPYQRWNAAYISIPGPYEQDLPSIYYIAPPDPSWSAAERKAYIPGEADLLFVSVHEVWPGHFLQFLHANRAPSKIGRLFVGYAFAEGWAHYTEEMMWEAGLSAGDERAHVGQLLNALLRNVRFLSAIALHTKGMTVAQSERMFREQAFQDPGNARQQAARGTFDPGYLNYTLGKLIIRKLRDDWTASRGGRAAWKQFHDLLLSYGGPPLPLVRQAMLTGTEAASQPPL
ncbi:MAG TPA: DUF885 domain-containing protein [Haliangium sp.]|nr:DUF885 domain-containing protein [Haliangium sp.]